MKSASILRWTKGRFFRMTCWISRWTMVSPVFLFRSICEKVAKRAVASEIAGNLLTQCVSRLAVETGGVQCVGSDCFKASDTALRTVWWTACCLTKANFMLGRVYIDIHPVEGNPQRKDGNRVLSLHQSSGITVVQCVLDHTIFDPSAIDEKIGASGCGSVDARRGDPTADSTPPHFQP
jgi:hypothetical protein